MSFLKSSPGPTNLPDVLQMYPRRAIPMLRLIDDILRGDSPFTTAEREMIFAFASSQNQCSFCYESHKPVAGLSASMKPSSTNCLQTSTRHPCARN